MGIQASLHQVNVMAITERVSSIISIFSISFIMSTYLLGKELGFNKPINRLIFFACFSNLGMDIAGLIAESGPNAGPESGLCQFQAFIIQMFLGVDALWAVCMSINVFLALFMNWSIERMRKLEIRYIIACYGFSAVPALTYLFVSTKKRGKIYGPALLWCWVSSTWDEIRIATLYAIVWAALAFALAVYALAFVKGFRNRRQLSGLLNPFNEDPFAGKIMATTEITVTSCPRETSSAAPRFRGDEEFGGFDVSCGDYEPYSITIGVDQQNVDNNNRRANRNFTDMLRIRSMSRHMAMTQDNADAWLYARVAFLFFCSLLICWVPSSANRIYSLIYKDKLVFWLNEFESVVLPLQGFFNTLVYVITSRTACMNLFRGLWRWMSDLLPYPPIHKNESFELRSMPASARSIRRSSIRMISPHATSNRSVESHDENMPAATNHSVV